MLRVAPLRAGRHERADTTRAIRAADDVRSTSRCARVDGAVVHGSRRVHAVGRTRASGLASPPRSRERRRRRRRDLAAECAARDRRPGLAACQRVAARVAARPRDQRPRIVERGPVAHAVRSGVCAARCARRHACTGSRRRVGGACSPCCAERRRARRAGSPACTAGRLPHTCRCMFLCRLAAHPVTTPPVTPPPVIRRPQAHRARRSSSHRSLLRARRSAGPSYTVSATASSGLAVVFSADPNECGRLHRRRQRRHACRRRHVHDRRRSARERRPSRGAAGAAVVLGRKRCGVAQRAVDLVHVAAAARTGRRRRAVRPRRDCELRASGHVLHVGRQRRRVHADGRRPVVRRFRNVSPLRRPAGNSVYLAAPQVQQLLTVSRVAQTITFTSTPPGSTTVGDPAYVVGATAGSAFRSSSRPTARAQASAPSPARRSSPSAPEPA